MKSATKFLLFLTIIAVSCGQSDPNKQIDEGIVKDEMYHSKEIGWSFEIPKGWAIISKDKMEEHEQKGKALVKKVYDGEINADSMRHLISFQKNSFNVFTSSSEPCKEAFPGEYEINNIELHKLLYAAFAEQGIQADTSSGTEMAGGLEFNTFYTKIYDKKGKLILNQVMYNRLINGYDFGVNITYNNEDDKKIMTEAFKRSTFNSK